MITTTTIWPITGEGRNPTIEQGIELAAFANSISGDFVCELNSNMTGESVVATRSWPDRATAEAWAAYMNENQNRYTFESVTINES